ncbi:MAG: SGNH/GDSL hydrolase family protein [Clostridia bacterium]|nr:SGNH/GDSL hydrolase family protein [Clostridia bacterium]
MELKGLKVNFLGDSITQGIGTQSPENCFVRRLERECGFAVARNYGKSGTRIARQLTMSDSPFDVDFNMRAPQMDDDADLVIVFGGTNDFGHGQAPLGIFEDRNVHTFYGAMHTLCQTLIRKYPRAKLVFLTPLHRISESPETNSQKPEGIYPRPLVSYVRAIREICEYYSIPVLDLYKESGMPGNVREFCDIYIPDGLHPNDAGHEIIAHKIKKFLENL